jgi:seryl-tRNA synthetase
MVKLQELSDLFKYKILKDCKNGHYIILPHGTRILNTLYKALERALSVPLQFEEVTLPKAAPVPVFVRAEMLGKWDAYLLAVTPFSTTQGVTEQYLLDPLQCTVLYESLKDERIDNLRWYDRSGPTYRNEDLRTILPGIKHREFHRAEFVYIGKPEEVTYVRGQGISQLEQLCQRTGLLHRIVEGTGCYEFDTDPQVSIRDLEVYIPFLDMWLEVAGCSVLGNNMTRRFNIRATDESELWSGCIGVGMERLLVSMLSYHDSESILQMFEE